jgi:hypothetical protein
VNKEHYLRELTELLELAYPALRRKHQLTFKNCFGAVAGYINGQIFISCGRFGIALRLPPSILSDLFKDPSVRHLKYFPNGHVKKEYAVLPARILGDDRRLKYLLDMGIEYALSKIMQKRQ